MKLHSGFALVFGSFLGLCLLKFGNPPIMEKWVSAPENIYEFVFNYPWPIRWAYCGLAAAAIPGAVLLWGKWRKPAAPRWLAWLPLAWLLWQFVSLTQSVDPELSRLTLKHFAACTACFYLGLFCLGNRDNLTWFWPPLFCGFLIVLAAGWEQRFGGLQETRRYFFLYVYPQLKNVPPEYLQRLDSPRIFATLFYPNALAGVILLLLPPCLAVTATTTRLTPSARWFVGGVIAIAALACLVWSGSKGGWLLMLLLGMAALLRLRFRKELKIALVAFVLIGGLAGFFVKYARFFQKGATSVSARFDYWRAAVQTAASHPITGTGPGTFSIPYQKIKRPESEMARLTHNDYLEQASDSGVIGFLTYTTFIWGGLFWTWRNRLAGTPAPPDWPNRLASTLAPPDQPNRLASTLAPPDWRTLAMWLGVFAWSLQSLIEFSLYLPALAWVALSFLGFLLGKPKNGVKEPLTLTEQPK